MTKEEACQLPLGVYRIYWKSGEMSLAAVGQFYNGNRWMMPANWTSESSSDWDLVVRVEAIETIMKADKPKHDDGLKTDLRQGVLQKIKEDIKSTQSKDYSRDNPYSRGWNLAMDHACAVIDAVLQKQDKLAAMKQVRQSIDVALSNHPTLSWDRIGAYAETWDHARNIVLQSIDDLISRTEK